MTDGLPKMDRAELRKRLLAEFERVVKEGGYAVHMSGVLLDGDDSRYIQHDVLTGQGYECATYGDAEGKKKLYWKRMRGR